MFRANLGLKINMAKIEEKKWYESKTIWVAIITGAMGITVAVQTSFPAVGWVITLKALLDLALRFATTEPIK